MSLLQTLLLVLHLLVAAGICAFVLLQHGKGADMRDARKSLGKLETRTAERFARSHQLPGAPEGDYAIIDYTARFAQGKKLQERLVWSIEEGDIWRVAGYEYR